MIHLVGPGGAGKSTIGALLAVTLDIPFIDLDTQFVATYGDISAYLATHPYDTYAERNVSLYLEIIGPRRDLPGVVALSSGFMTYRDGIHPDYLWRRERIAASDATFVLLPSLDIETCVIETIRRQRMRPFARGDAREEHVIRERFPIYVRLSARKVETLQPPALVVADLVASIGAQHER